ncbi:Ig-like domain-containing protein [Compostimonas suwonensis]|uniref:Fibronectin type-III domain-containing protein n=1 Tax=Compostimonas suwonensis TaxID=1048394 RepID=A0A2M9BUD6_9MICO|nr:Ig-like domain-containing protein [Compostimonas suwonensis]PJJ61566.1 hypothetical protein CLV54_2512 [Compostimonas suwonensis]
MISGWLAAHKSLVATATSGSLVAAIVATVAVASGGYTAQRLDLGDASVWVVNESKQAVGRVNTEVLELNSVVTSASNDIDVVQDGATVLVVDSGNSTVEIVDAASSEIVESVPLPPDDTRLFLAGDRVVIFSAGSVWIESVDTLSSFDAGSDPTLSFDPDSVASVDPEGALVVWSPSAGEVYRVDAQDSDEVSSTDSLEGIEGADAQVTSVGGRWAALDGTARVLHLDGASVDLSGLIPSTAQAVVQQPSAHGDTVVVAYDGGAVEVPLAGGEPRPIVEGRSGAAAAPTVLGDCLYAAWSDGSAWQRCGDGDGDGDGIPSEIEGMPANPALSFRINGDRVVLNDSRGGASWAVQSAGERIDNWDDLIEQQQDQQQVEENDLDTPPEYDKTQAPPVAVDDEFGARPGRTTVLPVLLNDYDPNGDVLVVAQTSGVPVELGTLDLINDKQQVQLTLPGTASGQLSFDYTITDGRGGSATATVVVTVREPGENSPPQQLRTTKTLVQAGGRVTAQVLSDWIDPDGDPFYLTAASAGETDSVSYKPEGTVVFTDGGGGGERREVALTASDGTAEGSGILVVTVQPAGEVPIIVEAFEANAYTGQEIEIAPLAHVRGGTGTVRLSSVPAKPGVTVVPDYDGGTFRFVAAAEGEYYIDFAVTDGAITANGKVRVSVEDRLDENDKPVTVPHTAYIREQSVATVDVLAGDFDPAGGVLLITGVMNVPETSGLRVEVLEQRILRVTLSKPLDAPVSFTYRVSNGLAEAEGTVTIIQIPQPAHRQAPIANPDSISVRVGDSVDVPVLANDEHPDNDPLTLSPELSTPLPQGAGLLFTSGNRLRYLAPDTAGNFTAVYRVSGPDGQFANAEVRIAVREADAATNNPPVPKTVIARVLAGETVRIPVPLSGIDPDGDSVQLLGQETSPEKGAVTEVGPDWIEYEAGEYSAGTDTFSYTVVDGLGARATGTVRVGISARMEGARNPIATADEASVRPGNTVSVQVLDNDSDPDNGALSVTSVEPTTPGITAEIEDDVVRVTAPEAEGRYGLIYEIQNERGGTSSNFVTVIVRADAPLARPVASDTVLTLSDVLDRETVDVDVLANVFFADGSPRSLDLSVLPGYSTAVVTGDKRVRVTIGDESQIIPFAVAHPDDPQVTAFAFIRVPGYDDALPQLRKGVSRLTIPSESTLTIDINKYVVAVGGDTVRLTDANKVQATHSNGGELVADEGTLRFTSADKYYGPASISFEVTDGDSADDPDGRTATLVLPITVTPRENQPPAFSGGVIDFEPGEQKTIELTKLTSYPYPDDLDELAYSILDPTPAGFTWSLDGQRLTLRAEESTPKNTRTAMTLGVRDGINEGKAGRIDLRVVPSTRPLAVPASDSQIAPRGRTTTIAVLANDSATNPFPDTPLTVNAVRGLDAAGLPAGVRVVPSADKSTLAVTVSPDAVAADTNLQYQVADATGDPDRFAWGTVRISVQDRPEPISNLRVTGYADRQVTIAFTAGAANNSPIEGYEVAVLRRDSGQLVSTTTCQATTCPIATPGNGEGNAVRFEVRAKNGIGLSDPVSLADAIWSDIVPEEATGLRGDPLDGGLRLSWNAVPAPAGASPVNVYVLSLNGSPIDSVAPSRCAERCSVDVGGLQNGASATFTVSARNEAFPAFSVWKTASGSGTPFGPPKPGSLSASANYGSDSVTLSWSGFDPNGDPMIGYYAQRLSGGSVPSGAQACAVSSPAPGTVRPPAQGGSVLDQKTSGRGNGGSVTFDGLGQDDATYYFVVWGYNRSGCTATSVATQVTRPTSGPIREADGQLVPRGKTLEFRLDRLSPSADSYQIRRVGQTGSGVTVGEGSFPRELLGVGYGEQFQFEIRGCRNFVVDICSQTWSGPFSAPASYTFEPDGLRYAYTIDGATGVGTATWSWTGDPGNGAAVPGYSCGVDGEEATGSATATSCVLTVAPLPPEPNDPPDPADPADPNTDPNEEPPTETEPVPAPEPRTWFDVRIDGHTYRYYTPDTGEHL